MSAITEVKKNKYGVEGRFIFSLLEKQTTVFLDEHEDLAFAEECVAYANTLPEELIDKLCLACIGYRNHHLSDVGKGKSFASPREVLSEVCPLTLLVPECNDSYGPVLHMELKCSWEEEHGLEWVVRDNKIYYVGQFNDEDPWRGEKTADEFWNYV